MAGSFRGSGSAAGRMTSDSRSKGSLMKMSVISSRLYGIASYYLTALTNVARATIDRAADSGPGTGRPTWRR
jgi:hypothetical protein